MKIRLCVVEDYERIYPLFFQLWPGMTLNKGLMRKTYVRALKSKENRYLCATVEGAVVGFCSLNIRESLWQQGLLAHIDEIVVDQQYRGQGIGAKLLEKAAVYAKKKGCARIELDSALHRKAAHRFYEKREYDRRAYIFSKVLS